MFQVALPLRRAKLFSNLKLFVPLACEAEISLPLTLRDE